MSGNLLAGNKGDVRQGAVPVRLADDPQREPRTTGDVVVEFATARDAQVWDEFVHSHSEASGYHLWAWRGVFSGALRVSCPYLLARRGATVTGVLPLVWVRSQMFGSAFSSLPFVNYGGILTGDAESRAAILERVGELARTRRMSYVLFRHRSRLLPALPARNHKVGMLLRLEDNADAMWNALDRKVRNHIRKAHKSGISVSVGGAELLDEFYGVFAKNMRDLGTPVYGRDLFAAILAAFPGAARVHLARRDSIAVAGALSYAYGDTLEVPSAGSLREFRGLCPNYALYWSVIAGAIDRGCRILDFGRSTPDDGTYHFKQQWGAEAIPLWWEYVLPKGGRLPANDRNAQGFRLLAALWKRLPLAVTKTLGPAIAATVP